MIAGLLFAVTPDAMRAVGLSDGDYAYICETQALVGKGGRLTDVLIANDGDKWFFEPRLAALIGVSTARSEMEGTEYRLTGDVPGDADQTMYGKIIASEDVEDRMAFSWEIRGPVEGVDSEALLRSGFGVCEFKPVSANTKGTEG